MYRELMRNLTEEFSLNKREKNKCFNIIDNFDSIIEEEDHLFISEDENEEENAKYIRTVIEQR